ncbi:MAG TPA: flagellar biosynthesis protein FliQ [bacterium]|jgi:flagellar biosynthetic protein FliQ
MTTDFVVGLGREAIEVALLVAGPMLAVGLVVGVVVSLLQALTQVQEMTLTFVPKILSISLVLVALMPWMAQIMIDYTTNLYSSLPELVH